MSNKLKLLGYDEIKPNLWLKQCEKYIIYHDYRKGYRWSYGFDNDGTSINIKDTKEYKELKMLEEASKVKTLDLF